MPKNLQTEKKPASSRIRCCIGWAAFRFFTFATLFCPLVAAPRRFTSTFITKVKMSSLADDVRRVHAETRLEPGALDCGDVVWPEGQIVVIRMVG